MAVNNPYLDNSVYRYSETVAASGTSNPVILVGLKDVRVRVNPASGGAKIQYSTDTEAVIKAATSEVWEDWDKGNVTAVTTSILVGATAIRLVNADASNTADFQVEA